MDTIKQVGIRLLLAPLALAGMILLGLLAFVMILFGRRQRQTEIARGMSRTANGCLDGNGDCTLSAWSFKLLTEDKQTGLERVRFIDALPGNGPGHCLEAWNWHREHNLL